jgi:catechol 2,3-dioxygenase-like lactoylglutathione lyase family enzyme
MTLKRMDNVLIVVDDLEAAKAFFIELGLKLEGETTVEGPLIGSLIGLKDVRATLPMGRALSWTSSTRPARSGLAPWMRR